MESEHQTVTAADVGTLPASRSTRADRLDALCATYAKGARYEIFSPEGDGRPERRVVISDPESGDRVGASGATLDDAIDQLTKKIGPKT